MATLDCQPVGETDRLDRFVVIDWPDGDASCLLEVAKDGFGILLVLGAVGNDPLGF